MPADPIRDILDRDFAVVNAKELTDPACALLREVINDATRVYRRCISDAKKISTEEDVHLPTFVLYYHIIEMADACEVLFSRACVDPAVPLIRSMFEANLQLGYILENDDYRRCSLQWNVCYARNKIRSKQAFLPTSLRGRRFARALKNDDNLKDFRIPDFAASLAKDVNGLRNMLRRKRYVDIDQEYRRKAKRRKGKKTLEIPPHFYSLFGGPSNLRLLSRSRKQEALYDYFYDQWSTIAHGADASRYLTSQGEGPAFFALRNALRIQENTDFVYIFLTSSRRMVLQKFRPDEPPSQRWFLEDVKHLRDKLDSIRISSREEKLKALRKHGKL